MVRERENNMNEIKTIPPFNCNSILPLLYDDSLSYYEILCKLSNKMNEIIGEINTEFKNTIDEKIDIYFNNLMIDAIYDEKTETIYLKRNYISGGDKHIYDIPNKTMNII
jgi:hypothetical protein